MNSVIKPTARTEDGDFFVPKADYLDDEFAAEEFTKLWPRVWQVACREEEITEIGSYVTYDIGEESIIVVRTRKDTISAYYNTCKHRGQRLVEGCGKVARFRCPYHAWTYDLQGKNTQVVDREDWEGRLTDEEVSLESVRVDTWRGFVFITMDQKAPALADFIKPVEERVGRFQFETMRYHWYRTVVLPVNWKAALEAFSEAYHVQGTHPQFLLSFQDYTNSGAFGIHSAFWYPERGPTFTTSPRLKREPHGDNRKYLVDWVDEMYDELDAIVTRRAYDAAHRVAKELPATATLAEVLQRFSQLHHEMAIADGVPWPEGLTPEYTKASHTDWHVFPNLVFLHLGVDGALFYRSRPNGKNVDTCIFDVWALERYAPGKEPKLKREFYQKWDDCKWGRVFAQDFENLVKLQQGMKSAGFRGSRLNPLQEVPIANFHRTIREYLRN
jgi:nitrite reductase/ring-hydroxylating ferredoxin subunit